MKFLLVFLGLMWGVKGLSQDQPQLVSANIKNQFTTELDVARIGFSSAKQKTTDDSIFITAANELARIFREHGEPDSSLSYNETARIAVKKHYGETSPQYANILVDRANSYTDLGQYALTVKAFDTAMKIFSTAERSYKNDYSRCLISFADFYITTDEAGKAEELCLKAYEMANIQPVDIKICYFVTTTLARLYGRMGLYSRQESLVWEGFRLMSKIQKNDHPYYASALAGVASLYERKRNWKKADLLYRKALAIKEKTEGKYAVDKVAVLNHLGLVNSEMRNYLVAQEFLERAIGIVSVNTGGEQSPLYPYCAKNLARVYALRGENKLAKKTYEKCVAVYDKLGLSMHPGRLQMLQDMAELIYAADPAKATICLTEANTAQEKLLIEKLDFLSEAELLQYLKSIGNMFDAPYRFLLRNKNSGMAGIAYNNRLLTQGIALQNMRTLYRDISRSEDTSLRLLWKNYRRQKVLYTNLLLAGADKEFLNKDSVAAIVNMQEKEILRRSAGYRDMKQKLSLNWQDVQKYLQPGETAIEFVRFTTQKAVYAKSQTALVYYAALLLRRDDTVPRFIPLCQEDQLAAALKKFPWKISDYSRGGNTTNLHTATGALFHLIWQPLEPFLSHTKTIYFSPEGILHQIAFAAIPSGKGELLAEKYRLIQLTSTRQLAAHENRYLAPGSIAMFGGINYNSQSNPVTEMDNQLAPFRVASQRNAGLDSFRFLPGTLREINAIKTGARISEKHPTVVTFTADNATEEAFRKLGGDNSPEVIHFATHGFTLSGIPSRGPAAGVRFRQAQNPLLRCGLIMAGGNKGWKGTPGINEDDGILTGLEISSVRLAQTQLVVLSACETGLGKIEDNEGVFGLQRAFKLAGVRYIMASLWQVPDKETAEFMEIFYGQWLNGKTIRQAFFNTQQIMRKKYSPYYWAGFTLLQ